MILLCLCLMSYILFAVASKLKKEKKFDSSRSITGLKFDPFIITYFVINLV